VGHHNEKMTKKNVIRCPKGHDGPFRYVEAIEILREVVSISANMIVVNERWAHADGFPNSIEGADYLLCWWRHDGGGYCGKEVPIPPDFQIDWLIDLEWTGRVPD